MADIQRQLPFITRLKLLTHELMKRAILRSDNTINRRIYNLFNITSPAPATKLIDNTTPVSTSDVPVDPSRNLWFRLFVPTTASNTPLPFILYFHGGGFYAFGPDFINYDSLCSRLAAQLPAVIASVNYRLAPEHRYPSQYEDGYDSLQFINSHNYAVLPANTDLSKCFIAGDSAGGNIAHHVTVRACNNSQQLDKLRIEGLMLLQPFFGGEERTEAELRLKRAPVLNVEYTDTMWRGFLPDGADRNHHAANVLNSGEVKNVELPRTVVVVGGYDPLQDWQRRYVGWMNKCGKEVELVEYPNAIHGFYLFPEVAEYQLLFHSMRDFITKHQLSS
ncbi:UNVERIFIED_CONTAM: putative carboxylesterase 18 [Sesamum angustifolium]|uniref:Carboxylesterase 18 n=1 Tax=Sesamum angustifolium TaxID=2727405 RepID=A0AAW2Q9F9_9LAMI